MPGGGSRRGTRSCVCIGTTPARACANLRAGRRGRKAPLRDALGAGEQHGVSVGCAAAQEHGERRYR